MAGLLLEFRLEILRQIGQERHIEWEIPGVAKDDSDGFEFPPLRRV